MKQFTVVCRNSNVGALDIKEDHQKRLIELCKKNDVEYDVKDYKGNIHVGVQTDLENFYNMIHNTNQK